LGGSIWPATPGLTYSPNGNTTASYSTSLNPTPLGLTGVTLNLNANDSSSQVGGSPATGKTYLSGSTIPGPPIRTATFDQLNMADTLTFHVGGSGSATIQMVYTENGSVPNPGTWDNLVEFTLGDGFLRYESVNGSGGTLSTNPSGWNTYSLSNLTYDSIKFVGALTVTNGETAPFSYLQTLNCGLAVLAIFPIQANSR
jgi:hypothetical protein